MNKDSQILQDVLQLPADERAHLVDALMASLNPTEDDVKDAWAKEIAKRLTEIETGQVECKTAEQVLATIGQRIGK